MPARKINDCGRRKGGGRGRREKGKGVSELQDARVRGRMATENLGDELQPTRDGP